MKKVILLLIAAGCVILLNAQPKSSQLHTVTVNETYEKINVGEDVKVILVERPGKSITITGKSETELTVKEGVLYVKKQPCCKKGIASVEIPVQKIKSIELNDGSSAYSEGQLQSESLTVYVNGAAFFELKSKGMINVVYNEELELDVKKVKNEKLFQVSVRR